MQRYNLKNFAEKDFLGTICKKESYEEDDKFPYDRFEYRSYETIYN